MKKPQDRDKTRTGDAALDGVRAKLAEELSNADLGRVRLVRLADHSTIGIGGPAVTLEVPSLEKLMAFLRLKEEKSWDSVVVGQCSNILFPDEGLTAVALRLVDDLALLGAPDGAKIEAGAGASLAKLLFATQSAGLSGLEFTAGIPGTVGGAAWGNAGAAGIDISAVMREVSVATPDKGLERIPLSEFRPGYRHLGPPPDREGAIIVSVSFELERSTPEQVRAAVSERLKSRTRGQPKGRSLGCVFKNPPGDSAGRLIDLNGFKGAGTGGAVVSRDHANFIINQGGASAKDVIEVAKEIWHGVALNNRVELDLEIRILDPAGRVVGLGPLDGEEF